MALRPRSVWLALVLMLGGCSGAAAPAATAKPSPVYAPKPVATYVVRATDTHRFEPAQLHGQAGQLVKLIIAGATEHEHDFSSPDLNLVVNLPPRQVQIVIVTLPDTPGTYDFWSAHPGDRDGGMRGQFVVEATGH